MEAIAIEEGIIGDPHTLGIIKREIEPDSSERDAESPDEGNGGLMTGIISRRESKETENESGDLSIKEEPIDEEASLSPAGSDADRQSGSGGEDSRELKINRRKRKNPVKLPLLQQQTNNTNFSDHGGSLTNLDHHQQPQDEPMALTNHDYQPAKRQASGVNLELVSQHQHHLHQQQLKQCSVMTEQRARNQAINSMPRSTCPICGDKANGLHYGIYTCEACKNFFKRSVAFDAAKSYVCKYNNSCNVNITEVDGVKMKGPRCQSCRYQACLDAGMYHSGVQRTRGGRHGYSPIKQRSGSVEKYPQIATPNISAVMAAAVANTSRLKDDAESQQSFEPADVVSVSMSPSDQSEYAEDNGSTAHHHSHNFLQKNQIWEQFVSDNVRNEVELLKSRTNIAETLLTEKTKQLDLVQKQVEMLKQHLLSADQLNKEQAIMIESLKRRLNGGRRENGNGTSNNGNNGSNSKLPMVFENGGVTITPVVSTTSAAIVTASGGGGSNHNMMHHSSNHSNSLRDSLHSHSKSQNLLSHLLQTRDIGNGKGDMATIEPVRDLSRTKS